MAIRFVIDSASDVPPEEMEKYNAVHLPLTVTFDGVEYRDAVTLGHREFYEKLIESDGLPVTSQIPPSVFADTLQEIVGAGDTAVVITLSSALSGTYQSACMAAADFPGAAFVVDSESATLGERLLLQRGYEMAQGGMDAASIAAKLDEEKKSIRLLAVLDTLEYLKRGGRISKTVAFAGSLLSIKPVITVQNGAIAMLGKARGSKNSANLLRKLILEGPGVDFAKPYGVAYTGLSDEFLRKYVMDNADLWQTDTHTLPIYTVGATIGTHIGPGAIAVAYFEKN